MIPLYIFLHNSYDDSIVRFRGESNMNRPWPVPEKPWIINQTWNDLLFAHWPIDVEILRSIIPSSLPIDMYDGTAWLGVVPFHMTGVTPRGIPPLPYFSAFPEINLRTYITLNNKPGVFFFSLDAKNRFAVEAARIGFHLPYFYAHIQIQHLEQQITDYQSTRKDKRARQGVFSAAYKPSSAIFLSSPGSLEHWLTERYCLYCTDPKGNVYRGEINHDPWPLQSAEAEIRINTLTSSFGITIPDIPPLLHTAKELHVQIWSLEKLIN
jgi:uncharacterized protein YqjF (DUF2071 family)